MLNISLIRKTACEIKSSPLLTFAFDLIVFFVCCVDVNSELGYLSPGEYETHLTLCLRDRDTARFQINNPNAWNLGMLHWKNRLVFILNIQELTVQ